MGILNAIFAPFIVLYLIMYSFFRYFEVCIYPYDCLWPMTQYPCRNTRITRRISVADVTRRLPNGNSASSTSCRTYSNVA